MVDRKTPSRRKDSRRATKHNETERVLGAEKARYIASAIGDASQVSDSKIQYHPTTKRNRELLLMAKNGDVAGVRRVLTSHPFNPNILDDRGFSPLTWAATHEDGSMLEMLLGVPGIDVDRIGYAGFATALMFAAALGHAHHVERLLDAGADPTRRNPKGETALEFTIDLLKRFGYNYGHLAVIAVIANWLIKNNDNNKKIPYPSSVKSPRDFITDIINSLAYRKPIHIPSSEIPPINIPPDSVEPLIDRWLDDLRQVEPRQPLETPAPTSETANPVAATHLTLPDEIPENDKYKNRQIDPSTGKKQTLQNFLENGWPGPYIKAGVLTQHSQLRGLDDSLHIAFYTAEGKALPPALLPTKRQIVDRELSHVDRERMREALRLARADQRRRGDPKNR